MTSWPMEIRLSENVRMTKCGPGDLLVLREIGQATYRDAFASMNSHETMDAYLQEAFSPGKIRSELEKPESAFYFLRVKEALAGYLKVNLPPAQTDLNEPGTVEIERIYVARDHQGSGLGKRLLEAAEHMGIGLGCKAAWLGVWEKNTNAIGFYRRMGYVEAGRHSFRMGDEVQSDFIMKKALAV